ncbi:mammalian cell entry protein (plasmid) [Mycolicibacterium fluoranthenivorans]|uniref:Mammalian cell entry protein n=1 Tax=Mycolicibacterium fluoranthenivorans TaxID=258505 RepID=A0A7G8PQ84_9MYCO|nr:mammalian cell entry protein [Mycolicibacterium fluoranthenivorans]QNJ96500.1 mammalian cell entry protein [Mycolicibacterium fluoranthenivorans]
MEDQQPDPDDLTEQQPDGDGAAGPAADSSDPEADRAQDGDAGSDTGEDEQAKVATRRRSGGWLVAVVGAAAALFVAAAAFTGAALQPLLADHALAATRIDVARTAAAAVTALWTYTPQTIDTLPDRAEQYLSGDFHAQYRKFVEAVVTPNKQAQVTDNTYVVGVGVESLNGPDAVALVFTNTTATSPMTKDIPSLKYVAYRLAMKRHGSRWLVTSMSTISFMDLTPQI